MALMSRASMGKEIATSIGKRKYKKKNKATFKGGALLPKEDTSKPTTGTKIANKFSKRM
jgi:hypothetical protein